MNSNESQLIFETAQDPSPFALFTVIERLRLA